jgi:gas vesicle protein
MDTSHTYTESPRDGEPNTDAGRLSDDVARGKERLAQEAARGTQRLAGEAARGKERLKEQGAQWVNRIEERGASMLEEQKQFVCEEIHHYSSALRRAAESLHDDTDERVATAADRIADELEAATDYLEQKRVSDIYRDAEDFARRRPEWVFGGLFLAGLAFGRFLKASGQNRLADEPGANYSPSYSGSHENDTNLPASPSLYTPTPAAAHAYGEAGSASYRGDDFGASYGGTESFRRPAGDTEE